MPSRPSWRSPRPRLIRAQGSRHALRRRRRCPWALRTTRSSPASSTRRAGRCRAAREPGRRPIRSPAVRGAIVPRRPASCRRRSRSPRPRRWPGARSARSSRRMNATKRRRCRRRTTTSATVRGRNVQRTGCSTAGAVARGSGRAPRGAPTPRRARARTSRRRARPPRARKTKLRQMRPRFPAQEAAAPAAPAAPLSGQARPGGTSARARAGTATELLATLWKETRLRKAKPVQLRGYSVLWRTTRWCLAQREACACCPSNAAHSSTARMQRVSVCDLPLSHKRMPAPSEPPPGGADLFSSRASASSRGRRCFEACPCERTGHAERTRVCTGPRGRRLASPSS
mmetsp:Transcript_114/g.295  ORF Transcript_114/g.295 Transcript_114/m.295 type:complete len:343 (-) Transcript_114:25-1053(-)